MKKIITMTSIILLLFHFILSPKFVYAAEIGPSGGANSIIETFETGQGDKGSKGDYPIDRDTGGGKSIFNIASNTMKSVFTILCSLFNFLPITISTVMSFTTMDFVTSGESEPQYFTIEDLVFGRISVLDSNYLTKENQGTTQNGKEINEKIKEMVATWYYNVRNIAIVVALLVLLYVGIRMAISTVAADQAKYKEMIKNWLIAFILVFFLHYIMMMIFWCSSFFMGAISESLEGVENFSTLQSSEGDNRNFEAKIMDTVMIGVGKDTGLGLVTSSITYWILVFYQLRFLLLYVKRFITIGFLIVIAPLVTVTYTIDKMGDKRAQAFEMWKRELIINILIQPLHAVMYVIFIGAAGAIAETAPIFAILFFMALSRAEKLVKQVFDMRGAATINSMSESLKLGKKK